MGYVKDLESNPDPQTFPGAQFEQAGTVPLAQCSKAVLEANDANTDNFPNNLLADVNKFIGFDLTGDVLTITANVGGNTGDFDIINNNDSQINLVQDPGVGDPTTYYIHDGGDLTETRDIASFAAFISAAGFAYTIKGGKLYTNMPNSNLSLACQVLWNPLT